MQISFEVPSVTLLRKSVCIRTQSMLKEGMVCWLNLEQGRTFILPSKILLLDYFLRSSVLVEVSHSLLVLKSDCCPTTTINGVKSKQNRVGSHIFFK